MSFQRSHTFPLYRTIRRYVDISIFVIRVFCTVDAFRRVRNLLPHADGGIEACGRECPSARAPSDTSDRSFMDGCDFRQEPEYWFCCAVLRGATGEMIRV